MQTNPKWAEIIIKNKGVYLFSYALLLKDKATRSKYHKILVNEFNGQSNNVINEKNIGAHRLGTGQYLCTTSFLVKIDKPTTIYLTNDSPNNIYMYKDSYFHIVKVAEL